MKRCALRICAFLVLGTIVNVAVAWGCALWVSPLGGLWHNGLGSISGLHWSVERQEVVGKIRCESNVWAGVAGRYMTNSKIDDLIPSWGRVSKPTAPEPEFRVDETGNKTVIPPYGFMCTVDEASGWPMPALWLGWGERRISKQYAPNMQRISWGIAIRHPNSNGDYGIALPLHPVWPGFVLNTALYATLAGLILALVIAWRRRRRIRRGLCPKCAYDLRGSGSECAVCPECGHPVHAVQRGM